MKFGNLYAIPSRNGLTKPRSVRGDGIKFVNMGELFENERIGNIEMDRVPVSKTEMRDALLQEDDLLFARQSLVREGAGKCSIIAEVEEPTTFDSHLIRVRLNRSIANPSFYRYYFASPLSPMPGIVSQCAQAGIKGSDLKNLDVDCPPLEVQDKIASILGTYDELIENNRKQIKLLEEAAQRLYKDWFVDLNFPGHETTPIHNGLPEGWERAKLVDVADVQYGFAFKADQFNSRGDGLPIIRIRNVADGFSGDYTTEKADKKYLVYDGDTVVGMDGDFYINSWSGGTAYLVQRSCRIKARDAGLDAYLRWAIAAPIQAFQNGIVGATVAHLGKRHIDSIEVLIPPNGAIGLFSDMRDRVVNLRKQIATAREARERLLPKLMTSQIRV